MLFLGDHGMRVFAMLPPSPRKAGLPMRSAAALFRPKIAMEQLSLFCGNLATCLAAGLDIPKSLRTCHPTPNSQWVAALTEHFGISRVRIVHCLGRSEFFAAA